MAVPVRIPKGPSHLDIDGYRVNLDYSPEVFRAALAYRPKPTDRFLAAFPKAGATWTQLIGLLIAHDGSLPSSPQEFHRCSPFLEMFGVGVSDKGPSGFIKTNLPYGLVPKDYRAKYLYVCRNPKDVCVSFYYHTCRFFFYDFLNGRFEDFFEVFMDGNTEDGDYIDHVLSWYEHRNDPNVLFINFEDMKAEPQNAVLNIAEFMSKDLHTKLTQDYKMLERVVECSGIDFVKTKVKHVFDHLFPEELASEAHAALFRKGTVGDWKEHFSPEMNARREEKMLRKLSHTDLIRVWRDHNVM